MDLHHAVCGVVGIVVGWYVRGFFPEKVEGGPCICQCNCHHKVIPSDSNHWYSPSLLVTGLVVLLSIAANLAFVFKFSWVNKGDEQEFSFAVTHVKGSGKTKGNFNSQKGLTIKG